jgi:hypothetical protein
MNKYKIYRHWPQRIAVVTLLEGQEVAAAPRATRLMWIRRFFKVNYSIKTSKYSPFIVALGMTQGKTEKFSEAN